jgi:hypothetical protein
LAHAPSESATGLGPSVSGSTKIGAFASRNDFCLPEPDRQHITLGIRRLVDEWFTGSDRAGSITQPLVGD